MNDVMWFMIVLMIANVVLLKWRIPIISLILGLVTLTIGIVTFGMDATELPLNPLFSVMVLLVSLSSMVFSLLSTRNHIGY